MARSIETALERVRGSAREARTDRVAAEDPLEIRAQGPGQEAVQIAVTMRTPDDDAELAVGFLYGEGLIRARDENAAPVVRELRSRAGAELGDRAPQAVRSTRTRLKRNFYATSSCGICGKASIDHIHTNAPAIAPGPMLHALHAPRAPGRAAGRAETFERTGGLHATAACSPRTAECSSCCARTSGDTTRWTRRSGRLLLDGRAAARERRLLVSGRASFELVQKAAMAGVPVLCAVSAPSSLAVQTAERLGMTLVGFLRAETSTSTPTRNASTSTPSVVLARSTRGVEGSERAHAAG